MNKKKNYSLKVVFKVSTIFLKRCLLYTNRGYSVHKLFFFWIEPVFLWPHDHHFSVAKATLELQMSVCLSVCQSFSHCATQLQCSPPPPPTFQPLRIITIGHHALLSWLLSHFNLFKMDPDHQESPLKWPESWTFDLAT